MATCSVFRFIGISKLKEHIMHYQPGHARQ
jgi:hypothetical protein